MSSLALFININDDAKKKLAEKWTEFLELQKFDFSLIEKIDLAENNPVIFDKSGNKFCIDFVENKQNYHKKKQSIKSELISKAMGSGKHGLKILDLSAGLAIDAIFLAQLGYQVVALERNPLIFLALNEALQKQDQINLKIEFSSALDYLQNRKNEADVIYFDPMFPEKVKSALPKQEMVFFRNLVGADQDATEVLAAAVCAAGVKRVVVKRPVRAPLLGLKPLSSLEGKLIRFDIYGVKK